MREFVFAGLPTRVVFGTGTLGQATDELRLLGVGAALVLSTPGHEDDARALADRLGDLGRGVFAGAAMHTPTDVTGRAVAAFRDAGVGAVVSLGGGSTIGLGKAVATRTGAAHLAIPTTYAGSEMTDILGETEAGTKTTRRDPSIRPQAVIYDVDLTTTLPRDLSVTSALNALAHAVEALYAPDRNPITTLMAGEAVRAIRAALPRVAAAPDDREARAGLLYGAWLAATVLGQVSMALHHKLAHVVGGTFDTPHAETHAILLPHTAAFNAHAVPELLAPVAETFGSVSDGLLDFSRELGAPTRLADLGLTEADLDRAATAAVRNSYDNPRAFDAADIRALLQAAWDGSAPRA